MSVDALVVGAGPVGLTAAMLLHAQGVTVRVLEQRDGPQTAPAAHVLNARTFEIWRQLGLDVDRIRAAAQDPAEAGAVYFVDRLGGTVHGSLRYEQQGDDQLAVTPTPLRNLSQHVLQPMLLAEAERMGVHVEYGVRWAPDVDDDHRWLLGCDGARSAVRDAAGIAMEGPDNLQRFAMVHFRADLSGLVGRHRGVLYWVLGPAGGTFVSHGNGGEWVYMSAIGPSDAPPTAEEGARLVRAAVEGGRLDLEVLSLSAWTMTSQIAERYRRGSTFLVGDAAHRFPPSGGMGLNSGVADAHNLAWKLAAVTHGAADTTLLDTYEAERRPVAQRNAGASLDNAMRMIEVHVALAEGGDVAAAIRRQAPHFDMLGLHLGYRYGDEDPDPDVSRYVPSATPGARLPHGWLRRGGRTISSLDLVPLAHSVRIGGPACAGADIRVGEDVTDPDDWWGTTLRLPSDAMVEVRPDQHVARVTRA